MIWEKNKFRCDTLVGTTLILSSQQYKFMLKKAKKNKTTIQKEVVSLIKILMKMDKKDKKDKKGKK